ncbi:ParB N-terminal domain-containing protein [Enterococcus sp. UD-01]|uniref:ParB N-terminal domain-containing protein n=1 Tax=Enterococcus sp. UD-01 TaxID=3373911 RepID=UPI003832948F
MEIIKMKIAELKAADYNPRIDLEPGMEEYEKLKRSLLEFGFVEPPIFNKRTGNLVGGHQHVAVAKEINLCEEIDVSLIDLPLDKEKALNVALNKISGQWNQDKLANLLEGLENELQLLTGFEDTEIEQMLGDWEIPDFEPGTEDDQGSLTELLPKLVKCPCCGE